MAATAIHRLTLNPMGKCSNAFFLETTNMIKAKLYMNVHWMVLYKLYVFCSDMKFKMGATAGPYGKNVSKRFFSETIRTVETKLLRNDRKFKKPQNIDYTLEGPLQSFCFFMPIENSRWPPPQDID